MLVVIRGAGEPSTKASFIVQLFGLTSGTRFLYVCPGDMFEEKWSSEKIELATSTSGIFAYYLLMLLESPKYLRDGMMTRLFHTQRASVLINEGFLSALRAALFWYFARSARKYEIMSFFRKLNSPKIFLVDEFCSVRLLNLKMLKHLGPIIYVSQDLAYDRFDFEDNFVAKELMYKLESEAITQADVVIACSERDGLKYAEMGARRVLFYPNIYPIEDFEPCDKDQAASIGIVLQSHWGSRAERGLEGIFKALSCLDKKIRVYMIGIKPHRVPNKIGLQYYECIPSRSDYLRTLSKSWIGINLGIHMGGANQRKYDYAMAGLVVFSDTLGARGDLLPHEYTYVDSHDLAAKLEQLLEFGKEKIEEMGMENRKEALSMAEKQREKVLRAINEILLQSR
jgi:hypothetical protein